MKTIFLAPLAALALAGAGAGAWWLVTAEGPWEEDLPAVQEPVATPTPVLHPTPAPVPSDWLSYTDPGTGVTLRYPPDWVVDRYEHAGGEGLPPTYRVDIYKPIPDITPMVAEGEGPSPRNVQVSLWAGNDPKFLEWWQCDRPTAKLTVAGFPTDLCVYINSINPHPQGGMLEGAYMFYTVHLPQRDLYVGIILYPPTWAAVDEELAKRIVHSLQVG